MEIVDLKTSDIIPYENNPRINDKAVKGVMNSIRDFGFKSPIIVDANHVIICGHTRLKAAKKIGLETCPLHRSSRPYAGASEGTPPR